MSKNSPTLADAFIRQSFKGKEYEILDPERKVPKLLTEARKFVLDDKMSSFMADLAWASLLTCNKAEKAIKLMESLRKLARAPHRLTWIEFSNAERVRRSQEYGMIPADPARFHSINDFDGPDNMGWLIEQHPKIETCFRATEIVSHTYDNKNNKIAMPQAMGLATMWTTEDDILPWHSMSKNTNLNISGILSGVKDYITPKLGLTTAFMPDPALSVFIKQNEYNPIQQMAGNNRYLWALLATINDLPLSTKQVIGKSQGYFAKGKFRKFVDHTVVTLTVPTKKYRKIAAQAIAGARRRAHEVRGHWRNDWRHPGNKIWVHEHQRGDASLGFITHDYRIKQNVE